VEDLINPDHAPKLRNPLMGPIKWNLEMPSVQFRIHHGEDDADDIVFSGAKASKFQFLCQEGGTVAVDFRIQVSEPDEEEVTKLLFMLNKSVNVLVAARLLTQRKEEGVVGPPAGNGLRDVRGIAA
jgi:hypothetical protein